jgi:hypothetical protein
MKIIRINQINISMKEKKEGYKLSYKASESNV